MKMKNVNELAALLGCFSSNQIATAGYPQSRRSLGHLFVVQMELDRRLPRKFAAALDLQQSVVAGVRCFVLIRSR